ncbi:hypothetical protein B0T19DRAFT_480597 [Cercophora scortea]|uniref:Small ribosomal subunit protein mS38 n=1 Tax=Cercophora scortea TaxID=314031 RepID=A0AAE0J4A6_9PEZI|nr:hypothetical protein B0T19DRAFT_480597 [Cercophora scortea]
MLPSSVRRAVAAAPQSTAVSSLTASAPRVAVTYGRSYNSGPHQRRFSSSKPSSPDDGSRDFAARPSVPASNSSSKSTSESKTTGEKRKRKAPAAPRVPSVPNTKYLKDDALALSTFFALHRPISVTQLLPKTVTDEAFAAIFKQSGRAHGVSDVLATLDQTVQDLESPMGKLNIGGGDRQQQQHFQQNEQQQDGPSKPFDGLFIQPNALSGHFLPFNPPPAPQPMSDAQAELEAAAADELAADQEPHTRVYRAILTIEETMDTDGQYKVVAHSPQLVDEDDSVPRSFLERMAQRQLRYEDARKQHSGTRMYAISVRRQKKLKMKKKKYKKLMRRTRNLRRKLDKL